MIRYALLAGLALGLGTSAVVTYQPARQPITIPPRVSPMATIPPQATLDGGQHFSIWVEGQQFQVGRYANDIPFVRIGNSIISINGNVSKAD